MVNEFGLRIDDDGQWFAPLNFHTCLGNGFGVGLDSGGLGQEKKQSVIPDDRRGTALAGNLDLPLDILGGTPLDGRIAVGNGSIGIGPTPRGPLVGGL